MAIRRCHHRATAQQDQFLADWGITHILVSSYDAPFVKDAALFEGKLIYERDKIKVWEIE